jgi:glycosyltransferase involved in cell wall biosynthesis
VLFSFPTRLGTTGIGTTAWHQVTGLEAIGVEVHLVCGSVERPVPGVHVVAETMRAGSRRIPYRVVGAARASAWHDRRAARVVRALAADVDVVHAWPGGAVRTLRAARDAGVVGLLERPNAHTRFAFQAVSDECRRLGIAVDPSSPHAYDGSKLAREELEFETAGRLLCPSDFVAASHRDRGYPEARILRHQYGYDPERYQPPAERRDGPVNVLFAGRGEPRKGLHHALRAWLDSGHADRGEFRIAGDIEPGYRSVLAPLLAHPSVMELGHVSDVAETMRSADVLVLPSLEEGSALVTYEARGAGCVLAVSDRTGAICRHDVDALVHPAGDVATLRDHLAALAGDPELYARLRAASLATIDELTWGSAAERLLVAYRQALGHEQAHRALSQTS